MPAGGAEIPTFLCYYIERKLSAKPRGVRHRARSKASPDPKPPTMPSAAGVLVPMLTLGLPTSATAAIMLSAFQSYGINPGPLLLQSQPQLVWGLIASLYIGNVMLLVLNLPLVGDLGEAPADPGAAALCRHPRLRHHRHLRHHAVAGRPGPALRDRRLGFLMRRYDFPTAPVIIGMILGPLAETEFPPGA